MSHKRYVTALAMIFVFVVCAVFSFYNAVKASTIGECCTIYQGEILIGRGDIHWVEPCPYVDPEGPGGCLVCECYHNEHCNPDCVYYCVN